MDNADYLVLATTAAFFVVGLVGVAKRTGLPDKYAPLAALAIGVAICALVAASDRASDITWDDGATVVLAGLVAGLSAMGLWSGGKATKETLQGTDE